MSPRGERDINCKGSFFGIVTKRKPIRAPIASFEFTMSYGRTGIFAYKIFKSEAEAEECARELGKLGLRVKVSPFRERGGRLYWRAVLSVSQLVKLAERSEEWREAVRELARRGYKPRGLACKLFQLAGLPVPEPPKRLPVRARVGSYAFAVYCSGGAFSACAHFKSEEEARKCAEELAKLGVEAKVYFSRSRGYEYWRVQLKGRDLAKLAELSGELRKALLELAERKNARARGPVTQRILDLAWWRGEG